MMLQQVAGIPSTGVLNPGVSNVLLHGDMNEPNSAVRSELYQWLAKIKHRFLYSVRVVDESIILSTHGDSISNLVSLHWTVAVSQ